MTVSQSAARLSGFNQRDKVAQNDQGDGQHLRDHLDFPKLRGIDSKPLPGRDAA